jgi:hypothetical protein
MPDIMTKQSIGPKLAQHRDYALGIINDICVYSVVVAALAVIWQVRLAGAFLFIQESSY